MSSLETIVRPFQTADVSPARPFFNAAKAAPQNVILQFGRGGGGKVLTGSASISATYYMTQYVNEKSRASWGTTF